MRVWRYAPVLFGALLITIPSQGRGDAPDTAQLRKDFAAAFVLITAGLSPGQSLQRGSGVVIDDQAPLVATAFHVIQGMSYARVRLATGREFDVTAVAADPTHDLALLRGESGDVLPLQIGWKPTAAAQSQAIALAGYRTGFLDVRPCTLSRSPVPFSELLKRANMAPAVDFDALALGDGLVSGGDSGGPLVDSKGQLLGLILGTILLPDEIGGNQHFGIPSAATLPHDYKPLEEWRRFHDPYGSNVVRRGARVCPAIGFGPPRREPHSDDPCSAALMALSPCAPVPASMPAACRKRAEALLQIAFTQYDQWDTLHRTLALLDDAKTIQTAADRRFSELLSWAAAAADKDPGTHTLKNVCAHVADYAGFSTDTEKRKAKQGCAQKNAWDAVPFNADGWSRLDGDTADVKRVKKTLVENTDVMNERVIASDQKLTAPVDGGLVSRPHLPADCRACSAVAPEVTHDADVANGAIAAALGVDLTQKEQSDPKAIDRKAIVLRMVERSQGARADQATGQLELAAKAQSSILIRLGQAQNALLTTPDGP